MPASPNARRFEQGRSGAGKPNRLLPARRRRGIRLARECCTCVRIAGAPAHEAARRHKCVWRRVRAALNAHLMRYERMVKGLFTIASAM